MCHLLHLINSHAEIQRVRLYPAIKCKCAWIWVCVCIGQLKNVQELWSTSPQTKYKQLTWASFNLIDIVLKNNTAYFGCSASKLTVTFSCLTFCWGGLQLWKGAWWKTLKKDRNGTNGAHPLEREQGPHNPSSQYLFFFYIVVLLSSIKEGNVSQSVKCVLDHWSTFILYWTY